MTKEHLAELIPHIESALEDGYPLQLKGDDLRFLLEAIKARLSHEPGAQPCAQQGGKLALNHDPTYSQPPSKSVAGPNAKCMYPRCVLDAGHDGVHCFPNEAL